MEITFYFVWVHDPANSGNAGKNYIWSASSTRVRNFRMKRTAQNVAFGMSLLFLLDDLNIKMV